MPSRAHASGLPWIFVGTGPILLVLVATPPIEWLPPAGDASLLLGVLLTAQAAIAALTLAVTLFVLQAGARRDADDRVYQEYIAQSWVTAIFGGSVGAVGVTGLALVAEDFGARGVPWLDARPGLSNLALAGVAAFVSNLILSVLLYQRALLLTRPDRWQELRLTVFRRDVSDAARAFAPRLRRVSSAEDLSQPGVVVDLILPDPGEDSADEASRALLDDARSAMGERRQADFTRALRSIEDLLAYAMDEIHDRAGGWGPPGSQPVWPPLPELERSLGMFRRDVIERGGHEHALGLSRLDRWMLRSGATRGSESLFAVGLGGHQSNYELAGVAEHPEFARLFRDEVWQEIASTLYCTSTEDAVPRMRQIIRHQERMLSIAMHNHGYSEFEALLTVFAEVFRDARERWARAAPPGPGNAAVEDLERLYRIALMGLGGRAMLPEDGGTNQPYAANAARSEYVSIARLTADIARAITLKNDDTLSWSDWATPQPTTRRVTLPVCPERYPLRFFSVRLLELAVHPMPRLDLHGHAQQVLDSFTENENRFHQHLQLHGGVPVLDVRQRITLVSGALRAAAEYDRLVAATRDHPS